MWSLYGLPIQPQTSAKIISISLGEANDALYAELRFIIAVSLDEVFDDLYGN